MFALALALLSPAADPEPESRAVLVARSELTSADGKHKLCLVTFGFPYRNADAELLTRIMNSDPYWHHFRHHATYLHLGGTFYSGGPRVTVEPALRLGRDEPRRDRAWTATFVLPAGAKLDGADLVFHGGVGLNIGRKNLGVFFAGARFASAKLTAKDVDAKSVPLRATVSEVVPGTGGARGLVFAPNHHARVETRAGEEHTEIFPTGIQFDGTRWQRTGPSEDFRVFKALPEGAALEFRFAGFAGWYKAETTYQKPKEKK
jgi:hypothetical protein